MAYNVAQKLIAAHLVAGDMIPGREIGCGSIRPSPRTRPARMVMLELEALGLDRAQTEVSVQYVDHNLLQADSKNAEDHDFLRSACRRFGPVVLQARQRGVATRPTCSASAIPGKTLVGSDSHTPAAGSLGMLAIGARRHWRSRWRSPANRSTCGCPRSGGCG